MSSPFLEENLFLPGMDEGEVEEAEKDWEQLLAEDIAVQTAPAPPPPPPPVAPGFTGASESATLAPPGAPASLNVPPPPINQPLPQPPDPMEQALSGLADVTQDIGLYQENLQLPGVIGEPDRWGDFEPLIGQELDQVAGNIYTPDQAMLDRKDYLERAIDDYNNYGILPAEFLFPQALQVAYDTLVAEVEGWLEQKDREFDEQSNLVLSGFLQNQPLYDENLMDPNVRGEMAAPYIPPPVYPRQLLQEPRSIQSPTEIVTNLAIQQETLNYLQEADRGLQSPTGIAQGLALRGGQGLVGRNLARVRDDIKEQAITDRNREIEAMMQAETDPERIQALREQYVGVPDGGRPYVGKDGVVRYSPFFETVYPGVSDQNPFALAGELASEGLPGIALVPAAVPLGLLGGTMLAGIEGTKKLDAYISESGVGSIYNDILTPRVRAAGKKGLVEIVDLPTNIAQSVWWVASNGLQSSNRNTADYFRRGDPDVQARERAFQQMVREQYDAEVPAWARLSAELGIALFADPTNYVNPISYARRGKQALRIRGAQKNVTSVVDDAVKTGTVADTEVLSGVADTLQQVKTMPDAARFSYAEDVLRRDIGVRVTAANRDLVDQFVQRSNYRMRVNPESEWERIVLEELGRAREEGLKITPKNPDARIRTAVTDIAEAYRRVGQDFWDHAYRDGYPDEVAARADAAWQQQLRRQHAPDTKWNPLDGLDVRLDDLMRWGYGPEAVYNDVWYGLVQTHRAVRSGETPFMGDLVTHNTPVTAFEQDFLRREFDRIGRSDEYVTPATMGEVWDLTHKLYGRDEIPLPPGTLASDILNAPGYNALEAGARLTDAQLSLLEWRSRLSGANLFDQVARDSTDFKAFTRGRADEVANAAPALESQKAQLRGLRDRVQKAKGKRDGIPGNANKIAGLTDAGIERLTYNDAEEIIQRAFSPAEATDQFIYSLPLGDTLSWKNYSAEQAFKVQAALIFDDLLVSRGKGRQKGVKRGPKGKFDAGIWTHTHSMRADPVYIADFFSKLVANNHPILQNGVYGPWIRSIGSPAKRDMMSPAVLSEIEGALADLPKVVARASVRQTSEFGRLLTQFYEKGMTLDKVDIKPPMKVHNARGVSEYFLDASNITDEVTLARASNDLAMRRAGYTFTKTRLDEHRAILHSIGIDEADFARMSDADARQAILDAGARYAEGNERAFRKLAREFLGERAFRVDDFTRNYRRLLNESDQMLRQIRQQESAIADGLQNIDGADTLLVEIPPLRPADHIREFAAQFGLPYGGLEQRPPVINELHMRFGGPAYRAQVKDALESQSIIHTTQEYRRTLMESSVETAYALTQARGGRGPVFTYDPVKKYKAPTQVARETAASNFIFFAEAPNRRVRGLLDGTIDRNVFIKSGKGAGLGIKRLGQRVINAITRPEGSVSFGTAMDEALWKSAKNELDAATEEAIRNAAFSNYDFQNLSQGIARNAAAIWDVVPDARIAISHGSVNVDDAVRDQLRRAVSDGTIRKSQIDRVSFDLPSGSQAFNDWLEIDSDLALSHYRPQARRQRGDVFSPYVNAAATVDFERSGWMIDMAINAKYRDIWDVPGRRAKKLGELQHGAQVARLGDEAEAFSSVLLQRFMAEHPDVDPYHSLLYVLDGLVQSKPDVMDLYGDIYRGSAQGRRFVDWLRTDDNWTLLKENWHANSPHFGMNRMPTELFKLVGRQGQGRRSITSLAKLDDYINNPDKALAELRDRMTSLDLEETRQWLDGMHARWHEQVTVDGVTMKRYEQFIDSPRGARQVRWKPNLHADDFDAVMYEDYFRQPYDQDAFTSNVATSVAEIEARRLGYDPSQVDFWMQMMASVKGNLGYFWLGIPPRYLVNNTMGNIMSEFLLSLNPGAESGLPFMPMPDVVKNYWKNQGGHFPRLLSNVFQSEYSEQFLQLRGTERRGSVRRGRLGGRSLTSARALRQAEEEAAGFSVPRAARWIDKKTVGRIAPEIAGGDAGITLWTDTMAWLNESSELNFRRRIYAKELWGHYKRGWGKSLDTMPGIDPALRDALKGQLSPQDVMATLTTEMADPRMRAVIMNRHSAALADSHLQAYEWTRKALRDYRMRTNFDYVLDRIFPYHFWSTKNLLFAGSTLADRPSVMLNVFRHYDKLAEQWEDLPPSFKNTLYLFTMPERALAKAVGLDGAAVFLRPQNITNPALFTMALTAAGFRDAWRNQDENTNITSKIFNTAVGGVDAFYKTSGWRLGPQFSYIPFILNRPDVREGSNDPKNSVYGQILRGWQYAAEPEGYRPDVPLPLAGLDTIFYGATDAALEAVGAPANMRVMRGVEWANQLVYDTPLSRQDGMIVSYQAEDMLLEGYFGDVTVVDGKLTAASTEAVTGYMEMLIALRQGDMDHPAVREALSRKYKNDAATATFSVLGAPFKFYSTEWQETNELWDEYNRLRDTYGAGPAWTYLAGTKNTKTGMYENPQALRLLVHWWATDNEEELQQALSRFNVGDGISNIGNEQEVQRVAEQMQRRAENEDFFSAAKPYYRDIDEIRTNFDEKIEKAIEDDNMVLVDIYDRQARRQIADVYKRAEDAGVELTRDFGIPLYSSAWWNAVQAERPLGGMAERIYELDSPSKVAEQDLVRRQTEYAMDIVIQQLGMEMYDPETGEVRPEFTTWDEDQQRMVLDQQKYDSHVRKMLPVATETYSEYVKRMAENEGLIRANLTVTEDDISNHMNQNVIPKLEVWREGRDNAYAQVANIADRNEREAAIQKYRETYGQDFYRTSPNERYVIDAVAGTIAENYGKFTIAEQKAFRDRFPELFDENGMLNANGLKPETVIQIGRDYGMDLPTTTEELDGVADAALKIQKLWYEQMHSDQKGEWFKLYGDPESAHHIPGLITEEPRRDPETGEPYTVLAINRDAMSPEVVQQIMDDWGISIGEMEHRGGQVTFTRAPDLLDEAATKKEMDNRLGQFWSGEAYLTEDERLRLMAFEAHITDEARGHDVLEDRAREYKDTISEALGENVSWKELPKFIFDDELRRYVETRNIVFDDQKMGDIYQKRSDYLIYSEDGQELREFFPEEEFLQAAAHWDQDQPALRELKDRFHSGELWLQGDPDALERWQAWGAFTGGENSGIERYVRQLRDDLDKPTWKQMIQLVGEDVEFEGKNVRQYLQERYDTFGELKVGDLYQRRGQWMMTGPGQGLYQLDSEYFDFYLPNPDDILGGSSGGVSKGSGYKSSGYRTYGASSRSYYSGRRQSGFARTTIDEYSDVAREVFFLDEAMIGGRAADSEQRMYYAQRIADRLQQMVKTVLGQSGNMTGSILTRDTGLDFILPFIDILMANIKRRLGEEPTLETWIEVFKWLGLTEPGVNTDEVLAPTVDTSEQQGVMPLEA